jgi:hypothetical protein
MLIEPIDAVLMLKNNTKNRKISQNGLIQIKTDIRNGDWEVTHQAIGFDWNGLLMDGQTRLTAIAQTGIGVKIPVAFGLNPKSMISIDSGRKRTENNIASLIYGEESHAVGLSLTGFFLQMHKNGYRGTLSRKQKIKFYEDTKESSDFVVSMKKKHKTANRIALAPVNASIFAIKASGKVSDADIDDFCRVLFKGTSRTDREAIITPLRDYLLRKGSGKAEQRIKNFLLTQRYFEHYLRNTPVNRNQIPREMIYKVPTNFIPKKTGK